MSSQSVATLADLVPGYEFKRTRAVPRFAPRPAGGAVQRLKVPRKFPEDTRPYQAGDSVHMIDWRAYGRTDQLLLRQQRDPAPVQVRIELLLRDSMYWDQAKAETGWRIALFCAWGLLRRGDQVEFIVASKPGGGTVSRFSGARMALEIFDWLAADGFSWRPANSDGSQILLPEVVHPARTPRRVVISDDLAGRPAPSDFADLGSGDLMVHLLSARELDDGWRDSSSVFACEERDVEEWEGSWLNQRIGTARDEWFRVLDQRAEDSGAMSVRVTPATDAAGFVVFFERWCRA